MSRLREKLPEVLLEGVFVVFAILLALAADEWRESRQNQEIAGRALEGIETEIRRNREELQRSHDPNQALLDQLIGVVTGSESSDNLNVQFEYALLSQAAWQTAQVTQAIHYADYDLIQEIARLYDLQELFVESQRGMVDQMSSMLGGFEGDTDLVARAMMGRLGLVMNVEAGFMADLDSMIVRMETR